MISLAASSDAAATKIFPLAKRCMMAAEVPRKRKIAVSLFAAQTRKILIGVLCALDLLVLGSVVLFLSKPPAKENTPPKTSAVVPPSTKVHLNETPTDSTVAWGRERQPVEAKS